MSTRHAIGVAIGAPNLTSGTQNPYEALKPRQTDKFQITHT